MLALAGAALAENPCQQPSPEEMAKAAGVTLPKSPWHVINIWWDFKAPIEHFNSLEIDVTIDRDVPADYNLYVSPCGIAEINKMQFYGGLQTNINGWPDKQSRERVFPGKGAIFSRWSNDKKTPIGLDHVRTAGDDCLVESAGYEGEFASVRRPFAWTKGTYTYQINKADKESVNGVECTWFKCSVKDAQGTVHDVGSLRFEGTDFTFWPKHSAFVEVYSTAKIPQSGIPKVNITFGWPRINGDKAIVMKASAFYPHDKGPAAPDCAWVVADGENCRVEIGPIFKRDEAKRRHDLSIKRNVASAGAFPDTRLFELRTYHAEPGKLEVLLARFRDHTTKLFAKHGMTNSGYWVPADNKDNLLIYLLAYQDRATRDESWKTFLADEEWKKVVAESEANGRLVTKADQLFLTSTVFSRGFTPAADGAERLFEMRTYTTTPGKLPALHQRFRDHTIQLFTYHDITSLAFFQPVADQPAAADTLLYFVAHKDAAAAQKSWAEFRADPAWLAAKKASEDAAGGSLTVPDGVKSVLLKPTDFSPVK